MNDYSVRHLYEKFSTTKTTVHNYLKFPEIAPYVIIRDKKTYLLAEGLPAFEALMKDSRVGLKEIDGNLPEVNRQVGMNQYEEKYVTGLENYVTKLEEEKAEMRQQMNKLIDELIRLKEPEKKKRFWPFW
jgi:predicted DNA-binding protein YlxM (UPF0122 family)